MSGEIDLLGVFLPPLLLWVLPALLLNALLRRLLRWAGAYRLVWHRPLFDLALFVIVLGGLASLSTGWGFAAPALLPHFPWFTR